MAYTTTRRLNFGDCDPSGIAYFPSKNRIYAVDAVTGELKWRVPEGDPGTTLRFVEGGHSSGGQPSALTFRSIADRRF